MKNNIKAMIQFFKNLKKQYDDAHIGAYSAEAAFFVLLSAVPMVMFAIILLGALAPFDFIGINNMLRQVFTDNITGQAMDILNEIISHSTIPLASVTVVFLLWAATKGIRSIADGINTIYGSCEEYNIIQLTIRSVIYTFVLIGVFILSLGVLVFASPLENLVTGLLGGRSEVILRLLNMRSVIFFLALTVLFATAYKALAKSRLSFVQQLPGAALAAAGWILYSFGYSIYIRYFSRYSALYGSLGAVMLLMLWLYMCMNILLCGALFNRLRSEKGD